MGVINWLQSYLIIIMLFVASMCVINPYTEFEMKKISHWPKYFVTTGTNRRSHFKHYRMNEKMLNSRFELQTQFEQTEM
jgi:hypothetical protein